MARDLPLDDYLEMSKEEIEKRRNALEAFKLQQEVLRSTKEKRRTEIAASLGIITVAVGIVGGILGLLFTAMTTYNQTEESRFKSRVEDQSEFNGLIKDATDSTKPASQRVPLIFSLQKYWRVEYELPVANALASMIANEDDQAIMEACAETIGNAYGENTPKETQARLRELLYGTLDGKIGVVMRIANLIYDRHKGTFSNFDDSHPINEKDWTKDPHYNLRIFYIGESVRKNWENLEGANFENASLPFILLYQADAKWANFCGTDMRGGRIFETRFDNAKMKKVNLRGADLGGAHFESADLESAYFNPPDAKDIAREPKQTEGTQAPYKPGAQYPLDHTKLTGAHFVGATLNKADFTKADLTGADLTDAHLLDTVMTDANLEGAIVRADELAKTKGKYKGTPKFIK